MIVGAGFQPALQSPAGGFGLSTKSDDVPVTPRPLISAMVLRPGAILWDHPMAS